MGKQDKSEKMFVACRDVFVEIINVLLYQGEKVLTEEAMLPGPTESFYVGQDAEQHSQFQDYSMFEVRRGEVLALYTMENQSRIDGRMPLRCAGYEGAAYRRQYQTETGQSVYPVFCVVLNWSGRPWKTATTIRELIAYPLPESAEEYLNNNRMHVFDMRFLEKSVRERFEGDVRVVLDYLSDRDSLAARRQKLRNPEEVMRMLYALSEDIRYLESISFMVEEGGRDMCDLLDAMENKGIQKGLQEGLQEGLRKGVQVLITTCKELGVTFEEAAAKLKEKYSLEDAEVQRNMKLYW